MPKRKRMSDQDVLDLLKPLQDAADQHAEVLSEKRQEWLKSYRCEPYGNERPGWSQTVHPTIFSVMEWLKPGLLEVFTGDYFSLNPVFVPSDPPILTGSPEADARRRNEHDKSRRKEAQDQAERLKRYIRHKLMTEMDGEQLIEDAIHDAMLNQFCAFKVSHKKEYDYTEEVVSIPGGWAMVEQSMAADANILEVVPVEEVPVLDELGLPLSDPMTGEPVLDIAKGRIIRKEVRYDGFYVEVVPPSELRYTPGYKRLEDCPLVAHVVRRSLDYIHRQEREGVYAKGSYRAVYDKVSGGEIDPATESEESERHETETSNQFGGADYRNVTGKGELDPNTEVNVWECYIRLDLEGAGFLKPYIVTVCGDVVLRSPVDNPYKTPPFEVGKFLSEPHRVEGRSYADVLDHRQRVASNLLRNIQDSAAMSTYRGFLTSDQRSKKVLASMGPGDVGLVPDVSKIQEYAPTPPAGFVLSAFELTLQEIAKESGVNENMQGLDNNALNKTAAGMQMRMTAGMQRQKILARRMARTWKRVLQRVIDVIRLFPPQDDIRVVGEDIFLRPEDAQGRYSVTIDVGVGPQDRLEKANSLGNLVGLQMKMGGLVPPEKILATIKAQYEAMGIDVSEYLPTPQEMNEMQQLQGQLQQLMAENQGLKQAIEDHAREVGHSGQDGIPARQEEGM